MAPSRARYWPVPTMLMSEGNAELARPRPMLRVILPVCAICALAGIFLIHAEYALAEPTIPAVVNDPLSSDEARELVPEGAASAADLARDAAEADRIWRAYEARWAATESYEAVFRQHIEMPGMGAEVTSTGRFYFAKPDLVRWEYTEGPPQTVVGDGRWIWVYQPDLEQVYQVDYSTAFGEGGLVALLAGRDGLAERYEAVLAAGEDDSVVFDLRPTSGSAGSIRVAVDDDDFDLRTVQFKDPAGSTTRMTFEEVLRNQGVAADLFYFTPPKGVDIIRDPAG
ncbi:MAG: outer membrane lipoprotein carrier protein [Hyphomicrobiaceae bacterium]|jgi:outer membrane lipoprotein carrier protein